MTLKYAVAVAALALAASVPVQAADWYVGGSLGASDWKDDSGLATDTRDTGYKLFVGVGLTPNIALEGGWVDLGKAKFSDSSTGMTITGDVKGSGWFGDLVGILPINPQFSAFAKIGFFYGEAKGTGSVAGVGSASEKDSGTDVKYGLGLSYAINKSFSIRGEWERYRFNVFDDKGDTDLLSAGVVFTF